MVDTFADKRVSAWSLASASAPLLALIVATIVLYVQGSPVSHESPAVLFAANLVFTTLVSVFISVLAARSYLASGRPQLLAICVGMIVWGASALVAVIGEHVGNYNLTIHNLGVLASALFHVAGAAAARRRGAASVRNPGAWLASGVALGLLVVGVIRSTTAEGALPPFFVEGQGATPLRTSVLATAFVLLAAAAASTSASYRATGWRFLYWYALGLAALAVGCVGLVIQPTYGSWLGWVARSTQYLGGLYMLAGTLLTMREAGTWRFSLQDRLLHTERMVRSQAELIRTVNDNTSELIFMKDRTGRLTYANAATRRALGMSEWASGTADSDFFKVPAEYAAVTDNDRRVMETGQAIEVEEAFTGADGQRRIYAAMKSPIRNEAGEIVGVIGVSRDITERKRHEEALRRSTGERERQRKFLESLIRASPVAIAVAEGKDLRFTILNPAFRAIDSGNVTPEVGRTYEECFPQASALGAADALREVIRTGVPWKVRAYKLPIGDRAETWWEGECLALTDDLGDRHAVLIAIWEITDRKLAVDALRDADRRKDEFLATLAHELRNPLSPMRTGLAILNLPHVDAATFKEATAMMSRQLEQLVRLIDDLLDVSRVSRGKLELRRDLVELGAVVRQALETTKPLLDAAGHEVTLTLPPRPVYLVADPVRLTQIVGNLLNNACKFTKSRGRIVVSAECQGDDAVITIRDNGIGIEPQDIPRIFDLFSQVDTTLEKSQGGLGIGLTLVKRLVEMHGGTIEARSEGRDRGSEFVVRLPVVVDATPLSHEQPAALQAQGGRRILVVDDNHDSADSLAMLLTLTGNEAHTAHDGVEAIEAATQLKPDLIVLDIGMPKLNGYDACRLIRAQPGGENIVIVATTGLGQDADKRKSREAGFDGHLVKPIDPAALLDLMRARKGPHSSAATRSANSTGLAK